MRVLQCHCMNRAILGHGVTPNPLVWGIYYLVNVALPHLLISWMKSVQQSWGALQQSGGGVQRSDKAAACGSDLPKAGHQPSSAAAGTSSSDSGKQGGLEMKQRGFDQDPTAIYEARQHNNNDQQRLGQGHKQSSLQSTMQVGRSVVLSACSMLPPVQRMRGGHSHSAACWYHSLS